jgi:hypothetical protein
MNHDIETEQPSAETRACSRADEVVRSSADEASSGIGVAAD